MTNISSNSLQSLSYCRCSACGRVLPEADWNNSGAGSQTPCCGAKGISREIWPSPAALKLIEIVSQHETDSSEKIQFAAMLLCSAVEMIIESIVIGYLKVTSVLAKQAELAFKNGRGIENLILVYEEISGGPMAGRFESLGAGGFMSDIRQLITLRNELACNKDYTVKQDERMAVVSVRDWCLKYFALLNNNLCQKGLKKKTVSDTVSQKKKSVLVVDDELIVLDFMSRLVKRQGLDYYGAATGTEGIRLFKENQPDCVLLDVALPDMDGLKVLKVIKEINPEAVVHMVTGIGGEAIEKEAVKLGTRSYVSKPVDPNTVLDIIKNI